MAQKIEPKPDNFITRLDDRLDAWSQRNLPGWLYKQMTFQPDRWLKDDPKTAKRFSLIIIALAAIGLAASILLK